MTDSCHRFKSIDRPLCKWAPWSTSRRPWPLAIDRRCHSIVSRPTAMQMRRLNESIYRSIFAVIDLFLREGGGRGGAFRQLCKWGVCKWSPRGGKAAHLEWGWEGEGGRVGFYDCFNPSSFHHFPFSCLLPPFRFQPIFNFNQFQCWNVYGGVRARTSVPLSCRN